MVWNHGYLSFGDNFSIGSESRIICFREITFKKNVLISWESQFFDTDFDFIINNNIVKDNCGSLLVKNNSWIGSRVTILKNTIIPSNTIVASNAVCSGNYKVKIGEGVILAGVPATVLKSNVSYIDNKKQEMELFNFFNSNRGKGIKWKN